MIDDAFRSRTDWRERAIASTRRRLKRLEIEAHRIKAELSRLESENENEIANELALELRLDGLENLSVRGATPVIRRVSGAHSDRPPNIVVDSPRTTAARIDLSPARQLVGAGIAASTATTMPPQLNDDRAPERPRKVSRLLAISPAWWISIGLHAAVLAFLAPMTYVILTNEEIPLFASMFDFEATSDDAPEAMPIEMVSFENHEMPNEMPENALDETTGLAESLLEEFTPLASEPSGEPASNVGQLDTLPTDIGTLMAGGGHGQDGAVGSGSRGAAGNDVRLGAANFFGTPARANRVVFLVDNSGSMKLGRMETTVFELARSIDAMTEKQEFYVVFYSDQAYPMFYPHSVMEPLAATSENKQKLYQWLQTVELCSGGALVKAMDLAASLKPHVVYVLSDGDIKSTRTMEKLAQANDRTFAIHTLGMGVAKPQDAQNLLAIAQANRGTFQMVRPLPAAVQMAKARPIRSNPFGVAWGQGLQPPAR